VKRDNVLESNQFSLKMYSFCRWPAMFIRC